MKGVEEEEYAFTLERENCPLAERRLQEGIAEGSFGTGYLKAHALEQRKQCILGYDGVVHVRELMLMKLENFVG